MGSTQSTHTTSEIKEPSFKEVPNCSVSGRKQSTEIVQTERTMISPDGEADVSVTSSEDYYSSDEESEEEEDEEWNERLQILQDAKNLRKLAVDYLYPEKSVVTTDPCATARNYFTRASAEEYEDEDTIDERDDILADMKSLKIQAETYLMPEKPVEVDPLATCRNYFDRASAPDTESAEEAAERAQVLADAQMLKTFAVHYMHPEKPVVCDDAYATGRNYFSRASAPQFDDSEEAEERAQVLADAAQLKQLAIDYLHPELPVVTSDGAAMGRNYFTRASAEEYEDEDTMDDRDDILADMRALKAQAETYLMPEKPLEVDPLATCRNYFDRASAPESESAEEANERAQILADAQALKKLAVDYLHPEKPVVCDDASATGRNYFSRASAPQFDDSEEAEERAQVLADAAHLKKLAVDYLHPEKPVVTSDGAAMGRNYFTRASAEEYEDEDTMDDRDDILADMQALKAQAETYLMPEKPLEVDPLATCRNYFDRASAPDTESAEEAAERAQVLADAQMLKKLAVDYLHPEKPVVCDDACATGRNYFSRASAPQFDDSEEAEERAQVLADAAQLKKLAVDYMHPEKPVVTSDGAAMGRNYYSRASAEEFEGAEEAEERAQALADAAQLKKLAVDYLHPELPVVTSDPCATGRTYFSRASAEEYEDEDTMDEREDILADMQALKAQAETYLMPEKPLEVDPIATCRNYFDRASAPDTESAEEAAERAQVLADAQLLKKLAVDYLHPEKPVVCDDACATGRNYFSRASAPQFDDLDEAEERAQVLADAAQLKKLAVDYMHPEKPVVTSDGAAMGRNYFSRASAEEFEDAEEAEERAQALADAAQLKKLAVDYLHPEKPVVTSDGSAMGRNYFSRASAEEYDDADLSNERASALADAQQLKKLATDYLCPGPVEVDPLATARCYFDRPSGQGHADHIHSQGHSLSHGYTDSLYIESDDHHANYYHSHHHDDHCSQSDHFEMDEDAVYNDIRESLQLPEPFKGEHPKEVEEEGEEGKLSRSPSCVMLFDEGVAM